MRFQPGRHPDTPEGCGGGGAGFGGRLNLLLSYAGWDQDSWVDRLPRLLEPMGVTSVRAACGREASEVIRRTPIHIAVVDLGLPLEAAGESDEPDPQFSEGGPRLLELLARMAEPVPVVAVKRGRTHRDDARDIAAALRHGAFAVMDRPRDVNDLNVMLDVLRRCLARHYDGRWPGGV
ncbi:MAG: hypothetical protein ACOYN0_00850 [Phycisphaerales bacterium]